MNKTASPASIDWTTIHRRLEHAAAVLERGFAPEPAERKKIFRERARVLAREGIAEQAGRVEVEVEVVEFILAYERYAIESAWVREIYPLKEMAALPGTPSFVLGIINVRGQIVSVVDLKKFFDLPDKGLTDLNKVIIMGDGQVEFGLLADAVPGMRRIPAGEIQPPPPTLTGVRAEYVRGIAPDRLIVLNATKILADPAIKVCQTTDA